MIYDGEEIVQPGRGSVQFVEMYKNQYRQHPSPPAMPVSTYPGYYQATPTLVNIHTPSLSHLTPCISDSLSDLETHSILLTVTYFLDTEQMVSFR